MVDPQFRLQNIAIEAAELQARRQMCWSEISNRATMFLTVLGTTVFGLALFGNATNFDSNFLIISLLLLPVLIFTGISSLSRMGELERQDGELVQGLNRLRHLRVQLDPTIQPYLMTSPYDDMKSVLSAYGEVNPRLHGLWVLETLVGAIVALATAILVVVIALLINPDLGAGAATIVGVLAFVIALAVFAIVGFRSFAGAMNAFKPMFPAPPDADVQHPDPTDSPP
jgi:hypothetical protein